MPNQTSSCSEATTVERKRPVTETYYPSRWRRALCRLFGHMRMGPYYGMALSHCWRCGKRTLAARPGQPEYKVPGSCASSFSLP